MTDARTPPPASLGWPQTNRRATSSIARRCGSPSGSSGPDCSPAARCSPRPRARLPQPLAGAAFCAVSADRARHRVRGV